MAGARGRGRGRKAGRKSKIDNKPGTITDVDVSPPKKQRFVPVPKATSTPAKTNSSVSKDFRDGSPISVSSGSSAHEDRVSKNKHYEATSGRSTSPEPQQSYKIPDSRYSGKLSTRSSIRDGKPVVKKPDQRHDESPDANKHVQSTVRSTHPPGRPTTTTDRCGRGTTPDSRHVESRHDRSPRKSCATRHPTTPVSRHVQSRHYGRSPTRKSCRTPDNSPKDSRYGKSPFSHGSSNVRDKDVHNKHAETTSDSISDSSPIHDASYTRSPSRSRSPSPVYERSVKHKPRVVERYVDEIDNDSGDAEGSQPGTPGRSFWQTAGKEEELCRLWEEEINLYDMTHPDHRNPQSRHSSLNRIASILHIPYKFVNTRINTLRTAYQKMVGGSGASGSSPKPKTARMREILRMCSFLRYHIKTCNSLSSYSGPAAKYPRSPPREPKALFIKTKAFAKEERRMQKFGELPGTTSTCTYIVPPSKYVSIVSDAEEDMDDDPIATDPISKRTRFGNSPKGQAMPDISYESKHGDKNTNSKYKKGPNSKSSARKTLGLTASVQGKKKSDGKGKVSSEKKENSGSAKSSAKKTDEPQKYSLAIDDIDISNDVDNGPGDEWYSNQATVKRKKNTSENPIVAVLNDRTKMMEKMSDTVCALSQHAQAKMQQPEEESSDSLWAKSIVIEMKRMDQRIKDKFKVHVYQLAMQAIDGLFP